MKHMEMDSARKVLDRIDLTSALAPLPRLIAVAVAIVWLPASLLGATNSVSSPAGFVRLTIAPQTNLFASMPFVAADPAIAGVLSNQLTGATNESSADRIQKWDVSVQGYTNAYKYNDGVWYVDFTGFTASDMSFHPGEGFFVQNRQSATQTVFLCGKVVLDNASTQTMASGFTFFGYPFSTARKLNDTDLANDGAQAASAHTNADQVSTWDSILSEYSVFGLKDSDSKWHAATNWAGSATDEYLQLGHGQWFKRIPTNGLAWTESRPYAQPFPTDGNPPVITDLRPNAEQDEMTLSISATGIGTVEVYYKDLVATDVFASTGWQIAATNVSGNGNIEWTDEGSGGRGAVNTVHARYYLVGNAEIDSDSDGVPDCRETFVLGTDPNKADSYKMKLTFTGCGQAGVLTNFPGLVVFTGDMDGSGFSYSQFSSASGGDLRFKDQDEVTSLNYEIEKWDTNGASYVWVQVPVFTNNCSIWAYWGESGATAPPCTTNGATWDGDYAGVWHMSEASGTTVGDSTANTNRGSKVNSTSPYPTTGKVAGGQYFTNNFSAASTCRIDLNSGISLTNGTLETWVIWNDNQTLLFTGSSFGEGYWWYSGSRYCNWGGQYRSYNNAFSTGVWSHWAFVRNGLTVSLYKDGVFVQSFTEGSSATAVVRGLGYLYNSTWAGGLNGILDEARISKVARASNWVWTCWINQASNDLTVAASTCTGQQGATAPTIANNAATNVTDSSAYLCGDLTSTGEASTSVSIYWGPADGGTDKSSWSNSVDVGVRGTGAFSSQVAGLDASTTYYYRSYATNSAGQAWAAGSTNFMTSAASTTTTTADTTTTTSSTTTTTSTPDTSTTTTSSTTTTTSTAASASSYKMKLTFTGCGQSGVMTNFPGLVVFAGDMDGSGFSYSQFSSASGGDLRFRTSDEVTALNYEIEKWDTNGASYVWVQVPVFTNNCSIWAYWGESGATAPPCTTNGATWDGDYAGVWHMSEASGVTIGDSTVCANCGTKEGAASPYPTNGIIGGGQTFTNTGVASCLIVLTNTISLSNGTLEAWVKWNVNGTGPLFTGPSGSYAWYSASHYCCWGGQYSAFNNPFSAGVWGHFVFIRDGATMSVYKDGVCVQSTNKTASTASLYGLGYLYSKGTGWGSDFRGLMDEARISKVARASNWVWTCWLNQASNDLTVAAGTVQGLSEESAPTIANNAATNVTANSAYLCGNLTSTGGASTSVGIYWGPTDGGTDKSAWSNVIDMGVLCEGEFSSQVTGLDASTTYYYRSYATNSAGESWTAGSTNFVTSAPPLGGTVITSPYTGSDHLDLYTDAGPYDQNYSGGLTDGYGGVTYCRWGNDQSTPAMLDDAFSNDKWFTGGSCQESGVSTATMESNTLGSKVVWFDAHFDSPVALTHFVIRTADHAWARTPDQFQLRGSTNGGATWELIYRFDNNDGTTPWYVGDVDGDNDYRAIRFDAGIDFFTATPMAHVTTPAVTNAYDEIRLEIFSATHNGDSPGITEWQLAGGAIGPGPEISVRGTNLGLIADGEISPSVRKGTDFGNLNVETRVITNTFTVANAGRDVLYLQGEPSISLTGDTNDFTVNTDGMVTNIAGGSSTTFKVICNPCSVGTKTGMVTIANNDDNENPYVFKVQGVGLDPYDADTDGDGMSDGWEEDSGLNPLVNDANLDPDNDVLTNLQEYRLRTDPHNADTDGDGVSDYVEGMVIFSDPLVADCNGDVTTISTIDGSATTNWLGSWTKEGSVIYARERCGYVDYSVMFPSDDIYALKVEATQHNSLTVQNQFDLSIYLDGVFSGRQTLQASYGSTGAVTFFLPKAAAGVHTVRIRWQNLSPNTFLQINSLSLQTYGGPDNDSNCIPDWQDHRQANVSGLATQAVTSLVSPICLEGASRYQDMLTVFPDYVPEGQTQQVVTVKHGIGNNWYADVLLSPTSETAIQVLDQNGAISYTSTITWTELNILDGTYTNDVLIRSGSSLLLNAYPAEATNGTVTITVLDGTNILTNVVGAIDQPVASLFGSAGTYTISGSYSNDTVTTNGSITVKVIGASFANEEVVCVASVSRKWDCPNIPTNGVAIDYDSDLDVSFTNLLSGGLGFTLLNTYDTPFHMVARLGSDGPILDSSKISSVYGDNGSYWRVVENYADGSQLVEIHLALGYVPSDIRVELHGLAGGVTFDDGTLGRTLTASDFNELGVATYFMVRGAGVATSVCHQTSVYQGTTHIGGN